MNHAETHDLLTFIAAYDNRRFDDATVIAWQPIFADVPFTDCRTAVTRHFTTSDAYLMPVHIRRLVAEIGRERVEEANHRKALQAEPSPDPRSLTDRSQKIQEFVRSIRDGLPAGDPDSLRYGHRHWRQVRQARERRERAEPNPDYDPAALGRLAALDAALAQQQPPEEAQVP